MAPASPTPFHRGLTPEQIVDAAVSLTRTSNLYGWSIRDLTRELGVTPSVVYHHVGGKDLIAKRVAERAIAAIEAPPDDLDWQPWFRRLLVDAVYPVIAGHPGVAKWLLLHGVPFPVATRIFDAGIGRLQRAGLGDRAALAYSTIMNTAMSTISMGDERMLHENDGPRDHAAMMEEFREAFADNPRIGALSTDIIVPFAAGGAAAARMREQYYRYVVDVALAGVAHTGDVDAGGVLASHGDALSDGSADGTHGH